MKPRSELFETFAIQGMSMRDYFAAKAMQALVKAVQDCITSPEEVSKLSYKYADAMMKAREQ
jgi:hypothetical protein